jgi:acyl-CoA thioesterase
VGRGEQAWTATAVERQGPGRYASAIGDDWTLAMVPQGGVLAAIAARAMAAEIAIDGTGAAPPLRSIHGVFVSPVPAGSVEVEVQVLRHGRSMSQAQATVRAPGAATGFTALAAFGTERDGFAFTELVPPEVPAPDECPDFTDPPPPESGWEHRVWPFWTEILQGRAALGHPPWDPSPRTAAEIANWFRFREPPLDEHGHLDPLGLLVLADMMPGAIYERMDPSEREGRRWFSPSVDLTVHRFAPATPGWFLAHIKAHHAGEGYASAEMALWDPRADGGPALVAWATQQMFFTQVD